MTALHAAQQRLAVLLAGCGVKQTPGDRVCAWRQAAQCAGGTAEGAWLVLGLHMKLNCRQTALHGPSSSMICLWPCLYITAWCQVVLAVVASRVCIALHWAWYVV